MKPFGYTRVVPRDLFNESKLLKCLGQLVLLIHDGMAPPKLSYEHVNHEGIGFVICQDYDSGDIWCANVRFNIGNRPLHVVNPLNSREPYPLVCQTVITEDEDGEPLEESEWVDVFTDDGKLTAEFIERCEL